VEPFFRSFSVLLLPSSWEEWYFCTCRGFPAPVLVPRTLRRSLGAESHRLLSWYIADECVSDISRSLVAVFL